MASDKVIKARLNLKIEEGLKDWIVLYAQKHHTTVTTLICAYFESLREEEELSRSSEVVRQI
jgi:hypothetical protein